MYKNATKCNETIGKWCKNKHGASKIIDTFETYQQPPPTRAPTAPTASTATTAAIAKPKSKVKKEWTAAERELQTQKRQAHRFAKRAKKAEVPAAALEEEKRERFVLVHAHA
jgi:hypothetical protein